MVTQALDDEASVTYVTHLPPGGMQDHGFNEFLQVMKGEIDAPTLPPPSPPLLPRPDAAVNNGGVVDGDLPFHSSAKRDESSVFSRRDGHQLGFDAVTLSTKATSKKAKSGHTPLSHIVIRTAKSHGSHGPEWKWQDVLT